MEMYLLDGKPCKDINEFVTCYNNEYYRRNNGYVAEKIIDDLLYKKDFYTPNDIFFILAWKISGIDMKKTNNLLLNPEKKIFYHENRGWIENELKGKNSGSEIELEKVLELSATLSKKKTCWMHKGFIEDDRGASALLKELAYSETKGMGAVYYLTLLYFITGSRWAIYDEKVYKAMMAIQKGKKPFNFSVEYQQKLPEKGNNYPERLSQIVISGNDNQYRRYVDFIKEFEKELPAERKYSVSRDIDRALWAYGHFF